MPEEHKLPEGFVSIKGKKARKINREKEPDVYCRNCGQDKGLSKELATWWVGESPEDREPFCDYHFMRILESCDLMMIMSQRTIDELKKGNKKVKKAI